MTQSPHLSEAELVYRAALQTLRQDFEMLQEGLWVPDYRSIEASLDVIDRTLSKPASQFSITAMFEDELIVRVADTCDIRIMHKDDGISVDICALQGPPHEPVATTWAHHHELMDERSS